MKITFSPQVRGDGVAYTLAGTVLTCNGVETDLAAYAYDPDAPHPWIVGQPSGNAVALILPLGPDASEAARFPQPIEITSGSVPLPQ